MSLDNFKPVDGLLASLDLLQITQDGPVLHLRLNRPGKRNAISDTLIAQIHTAFVNLPQHGAPCCSAAKAITSAPDWTCRSWWSATSSVRCCTRAAGMWPSMQSSSAVCR